MTLCWYERWELQPRSHWRWQYIEDTKAMSSFTSIYMRARGRGDFSSWMPQLVRQWLSRRHLFTNCQCREPPLPRRRPLQVVQPTPPWHRPLRQPQSRPFSRCWLDQSVQTAIAQSMTRTTASTDARVQAVTLHHPAKCSSKLVPVRLPQVHTHQTPPTQAVN
jgi:hypothetical protein